MILFSDLHLEPKSAPVALEVLRRIPELCRKHNDDHVAMLGDYWMVRHTLPVKLLVEARDIMRSWFVNGVSRLDVLPGNHDMVDMAGRNALEVFDGLGASTLVHTEPGWTSDGFWLPYRHTHDEIRAALTKASTEIGGYHPPVLFAHIGLLGAWMNALKKDEHGFSSSEILSLGFKRVFCGHYHRHHAVQKGVVYVGSPYQVSYAEAGQAKGVMRWDGTTAEFIELDVGPRHHKVVFDVDHPAPLAMPAVRDGDKLWVVVKGQMASAAKAVVQQNLAALGIEPARIEMDLQPEARAARIEVKAGEKLTDIASRFVDAQDVPDEYRAMLKEAFRRTTA